MKSESMMIAAGIIALIISSIYTVHSYLCKRRAEIERDMWRIRAIKAEDQLDMSDRAKSKRTATQWGKFLLADMFNDARDRINTACTLMESGKYEEAYSVLCGEEDKK